MIWEKLAHPQLVAERIETLAKEEKKPFVKGITWESEMAAQKEIHVLNWPEKELIKLPTALEDEIIACFRAEQELMAQKHLAQNLRNLLNKSDQSQRALEMQLNIIGGSVNVSLGEELGLPEHNLTPLSFEEEFNAPKPNPSPYPKLHPPVKKE